MSLYFALLTVENNKNKKSVKFQGDMLNFCDFIQVYVFTTNHHLKHEEKVYQYQPIQTGYVGKCCYRLDVFVANNGDRRLMF